MIRAVSRARETGDALGAFLDAVSARGLELYPAQEEAILHLAEGKNLILNTPTGSGKSLVALALHFLALVDGKRSFYTCPIKALVSEKFFSLCEDFGPENVGMMTGDATVNRDAPIVCCTAEILANMALREGALANVDQLVMDEFHYYADRERGVSWQIPLLLLRKTRFLLMSATFGNTDAFERILRDLTGHETTTVRSRQRPVPLDFSYRELFLHELIRELLREGRVPAYVVNFTQRASAEEAQNLMSIDLTSKEEKKKILEELGRVRFDSPYGREVQRFLRHGIGVHHAGLLPKYRRIVERLAQAGLLKVISGTDTLGVGVNIPIRTVVFSRLCKYDGEKTAIVSIRDLHQISGRAGRKGFDVQGSVVVLAPEHVVENLHLDAKTGSDGSKKKKVVRKKPPERGYVHWDRTTFDRLCESDPEPLVSRFSVSHGMIINVLGRNQGCMPLARLIRNSHDRPHEKRQNGRTALLMLKSLISGGVVERRERVHGGHRLVVNPDLQHDFSLHHALALYLVETVRTLEREREDYPLVLLSLVESIAENPDVILQRQVDKLRRLRFLELKAAGVEFEERQAELEKVEHPKPEGEFIYSTFNAFAHVHPWVGSTNIQPKSIAREMYEGFFSFSDYVKEYDLERSEGVLLRYLSEIFKVLVQTVPVDVRNESVEDLISFFEAIVRQIDSSLLDEWEAMVRGEVRAPAASDEADRSRTETVLRDERALTILLRNGVFSVLRALSRHDYDEVVRLLAEASGEESLADRFNARALRMQFADFFTEHEFLRIDAEARSSAHFRLERLEHAWNVEQVLVGSEGPTDWVLHVSLDLGRTKERGRPTWRAVDFARVGQ